MAQAQSNHNDAVSGLQPLSYLNTNQPANVLFVRQSRAPTTSDRRYKYGTLWLNTASNQVYSLVQVVDNSATWSLLGPGASDVDTLTGDSGGAISPTAGNINILGGDGLSVAGSGSTLTINKDTDSYPAYLYVVGNSGEAGYTTVQSALDAIGASGTGQIFLQPGTYTEDLTFPNGINVGLITGSDEDAGAAEIVGVHTPPATGNVVIWRIKMTSTTDIFSSAVAGSANITLVHNNYDVNGYIWNLVNWTGSLAAGLIADRNSTSSGIVDNSSGSSAVFLFQSSLGVGAGNAMLIGGTLFLERVAVSCPVTLSGAGPHLIVSSQFSNTLTLSSAAAGTITHTDFITGANAAITMSSSADWIISSVTIDSSASPAIDGAGSGNLEIGSLSFMDDSTFAATLTVGTAATVTSGSFETCAQNAGVTLSGTSLTADGTDANIGITVTPKGTGTLALANGTAGTAVTMANGINTVAQSVSIANGASAADSTVNILSGVGTAGAGTLNMANNNRVTTVDLADIAPAAARTINIAGGDQAQNDTVNILNGAPTAGTQTLNVMSGNGAGGTQAVNIAQGTGGKTVNIATGAGANTVALGSTNTTSATTINSGSGGVTLTGAVSATTGDLAVTRSAAAAEVTSQVTNSDNTNTASDSFFEAAVGGTSGGNPGIRFQISGGQAYSMGIDNASASDDLLICGDNDIGTDPLVTIAEAGTVTVEKGNLVLGAVATQLQMNGGAVTDFIGTATLTAGTVTVANTNIAANDRIFIQRQGINGSTALGSLTYSISAATSFTITAVQAGTPAATETNDVSIVMYFIVREN